MRLGELLGLPVRTESGDSLGHVFDVRGELGARSLRLTGLVVGERGFLERLGLGAPRAADRIRTHAMIPWTRIIRADGRGVLVRDD